MRLHEQKHSKNPISSGICRPPLARIDPFACMQSSSFQTNRDDDDDRHEKNREGGSSVAACRHARCIPSGRHGHMRTGHRAGLAAMAVVVARHAYVIT